MKDYVIMKCDVWRIFYEPFRCFCCGKEISKEQFEFSALCGYCDVGKCRKGWRHGRKDIMKEGKEHTKLNILEALEK
ncbi:MAG: hypothetical protein AABY22_33460 [Nanoarchaeota archaeon]|mgnify:CR=1 FL=1